MPYFFSDIPGKVPVVLSQAANIFLFIVMIYIFQYIFNSQFSCSCTKEFHFIVIIYVGLIPIILFLILKLIKQTRTKVCGGFCFGIWSQIFQLFGIYLFWGGFILLDGDLYLCMATKHNTLRELPCKKNLTLQEMNIIAIYKNLSQFFGYISIAVGFFGWWLISNTKVGMYCDRCSCQCLKDCCCKICETKPYYARWYEELLSLETDKHLGEKLQEIAKKRAESICSKHLAVIENSEFRKIRTAQMSEKAQNAWSEISHPLFYTSDLSEDVNCEFLYI